MDYNVILDCTLFIYQLLPFVFPLLKPYAYNAVLLALLVVFNTLEEMMILSPDDPQ